MDERTINGSLQRIYQAVVSDDVGPYLRARGFDTSRSAITSDSTFVRGRGSLYDVIGLQPDWHNGTRSWHGFFVNVGIGSTEVDFACPEYERSGHPLKGSLLHSRWEDLVPELPYEVRFDHRTDMRQFAAALCDGFELVLAEMEQIRTTKELVRHAVDNNLLIEYDKTCRYLAAIDDIDTLTEYVTTLHEHFGGQDRWSFFNREISTAVGRWAPELQTRGVLDPITPGDGHGDDDDS